MRTLKDLKLNAQEIAINELLAANGIEFNCVSTGELLVKDGWTHDAYQPMFIKNGKSFSAPYSCGIGHRLAVDGTLRKLDFNLYKRVRIAQKYCNDRSLNPKGTRRLNQYLIVPSAADILYGFISDKNFASDSFTDFCANLGYDEDSRKALDTYLQCQEIGKKLQELFGSLLLQIEEILQDY